MKLYDKVVRFSNEGAKKEVNDRKLLIDGMQDYARHYATEKMSLKGLGGYDTSKTLAQKDEKINNLFTAILEEISAVKLSSYSGEVERYAKNSQVVEMATYMQDIMIDSVMPTLISATNMAMLAEFHYGGYNEVYKFKMKDTTPYKINRAGRRQKHTKTQERKATERTIATDYYGATTYVTLPQVIKGEASIAENAMLLALGFQKKIYTMVVKKFMSEVEGIPVGRWSISGFAEKPVIKKLEELGAVNGYQPVLLGSKVASKDILPENAVYRMMLSDPYNTSLGHMSEFNGTPVVTFEATFDEDSPDETLRLPDDRIYAITPAAGKLIHVAIGHADSTVDDAKDNNNLAILSSSFMELGVELATNHEVLKIEL